METQYIYLLQEREFIKTKENIFKIGKTKQNNNDRIRQYPKGSILLFQMICSNCDNIERVLIKIFKENYKHCKEIGNEYFQGDSNDMIKNIFEIIKDFINSNDINEIEKKDINTEKKIMIENEIDENYEVKTYDDLKNISYISKIIITNKDTKEGYLKFINSPYRKLYNKYSPEFNEEQMETLDSYITHLKSIDAYKIDNQIFNSEKAREQYEFINNSTGVVIKYREYNSLNMNDRINYNLLTEFKFVDLIWNEEEIIKDIIDKCYTKTPTIYKLKYNEYIIMNKKKHYSYGQSVEFLVFNSETKTIQLIDNYNEIGIIHEIKVCKVLFRMEEKNDFNKINISIVEKILNWFILDKSKLNQYKKLCYSIFVKPEDKGIVFYDYHNNDFYGYLTNFISELCYKLNSSENCIYSEYYYEDIINYKKIIKNNNIRLVIITKHEKHSFEKMISDFMKLGIKNIIVNIKDKNKNIYNGNYENFELYLKEINDELKLVKQDKENFDIDIFYSNSQLELNYFAWCIS